jgi:hypothetical protein
MGRRFRWVLMVLAAAALPVQAEEFPLGAPGIAFYTIPPQLPQGTPGDVLRVRPLEGTMALPAADRTTLTMYLSRTPENTPVAVTGSVSIPKGQAPDGGWPVIV